MTETIHAQTHTRKASQELYFELKGLKTSLKSHLAKLEGMLYDSPPPRMRKNMSNLQGNAYVALKDISYYVEHFTNYDPEELAARMREIIDGIVEVEKEYNGHKSKHKAQ